MLSMTGKPLNGKLCLTRIMLRSTNMQQQDWLRSTPTRSAIFTTSQGRPNSTRSSLSNTVASLGKNLSTDGNHTEVGTNAVLVGKESTKPSPPPQLKNDWNRCALNFSLRPANPERHSPHKPIQKKITRAQVTANLLAKQTNQQSNTQHTLEETKGYLASTGSTTNRIQDMPATLCGREEIDRIARIVAPKRKLMLRTGQSSELPSRRPAIISGSPPITEIFRRQTVKASQIETSHPEAGTPATASDTSQAHALLPEGHEPQPQSVRQAQRNTSETTSPLAPRQLIYSEATSAPRAPGLSDSQISQLPISELRYAGSLQAMTPSRLLACRSSCPHQWKATSLQHQRSSNSWLRSPRAHHKLLRPCWRRGPSRPGGLLLAGEVRLQAAAAAAPAKVPSCNSSKRHFRKNMHTCIHSIPFHSIPFHSIPFITLHYITLHCIALHCIALHYITLHYITYITYIIYIPYIPYITIHNHT